MSRPQWRSRAGFTLPELMVSLALLGVLLSAVLGVVLNMQRSYVRQRDVARAEDALRVAETTISTLLQTAGANPMGLTGGAAPRLEPNPLNNASFDNLRVVADFNPANGVTTGPLEDVSVWVANDTLYVRWQAGQAGAPIAYPVRSLLFEYFAADGTPLTTVAQVANAKRVRFTVKAPRHARTNTLAVRETWVYLRNR